MSAWEKILALLGSRKFWAMVTSIVAAAAALATNQITSWEFIIAVVASMAAFSGGVAIEDAGIKIGAGLAAGQANQAQVQAQPAPSSQAEPAERATFPGADHSPIGGNNG